jgi:tetratricopeptide (TPR) repeat protein
VRSDDGSGSTTVAPGALSALLEELFKAPAALLGDAWSAGLRPGTVVGRFELVRELGRGGFGVVWEARDRQLGRKVAFKAVRAGPRAAVAEERLLREAEAAAQLSHPNIVALHDVGRSEHGPYLILELLQGQTLAARLRHGALAPGEAVGIAVEVAKALAHAHAQGVVHRDLKPGNVFLCADGQVKVLDLGLAHAFGRRRVEGGTPAYMAPEQAAGAPEDERTDVFALGVMLFEMLTGRLPFANARALASSGRAPTVDVPGNPALGEVVGRMLEKQPVDRPRDGGAVLEALSSLRDALERAAPGPAPVRVRRHGPRLAGLAAAGAVLGGALAAVLLIRGKEPFATTFGPGTDGRITVAVADFANDTRDPDLDALSGLLITSLEQARDLRVLTRSRMVDILRELGKDRVDRIDESLAREVGRKAGAKALLLGSVRRFEDVYALELRALDPAKDVYLVTLKEQGSGKRVIPELLDRLGERTRLALRGSAGEPRHDPSRLVTRNLEAYRHYFEGMRLDDEYQWEAAAVHYREALRLDPGFALAHARLAADTDVRAASERVEHQGEALSHADRLPEPDRLAVSAEGEILDRRLDDAARLLEEALVLRPDDKRLLLRLAQVKAHDDFTEARPIVERALALDPSFVPAQDFLLVSYAFTGQHEKCQAIALQNATRWPSPLTYTILEAARMWAGDYPGALEAGRKSAELFGASGLTYLALDLLLVDDFQRAEGEARRLWTASAVLGWELEIVLRSLGKLKEARRVLDEMERSGAVWQTQVLRIQHAAADGDRARLRSLAREDAEDTDLPWLALTLAVAGEVEEAERILREHPRDRLWRNGIQGRTAALDVLAALRDRARGDPGAAKRRLQAARRRALVPFAIAIDYFLGETCHLAGDDPCAVEALSDGRRIFMPIMPWWPGPLAYPRSLLMLSRSLDRLGRREEAVRAADKLLALWERADPDLPLLAEAKALRRRLAEGR